MAGVCAAELRVPMGEALKAAIVKPNPEYSPVARQMKVAGKVEIEATVAPTGEVEAVRAVSGNPLLTSSAIAAVKKWKFTPFTENGAAVKAVISLNFDFKP
ncbi:MAG TPA: energy transducer TonB [Bryobacteraceae bacterium]|nr:energy transducer TonB [Bryobacteraceae bacterium]